ncbi:hypothetical protein C6376_37820 [Streptomyces sp. P3]|uniref:hypothetical protein n=1 Tax=Streptomyces sp. P3 TaxID=2135430 RepID=UPI000D1A7690|nr:hypothetical protein [Streptomyces sp. P3]AVV46255.1 hypothetical protein C6376_37820 [Streptomyces sp. P3]
MGPPELRRTVVDGAGGRVIRSAADLEGEPERDGGTAADDGGKPFTHVAGRDGLLRLAPRRSEHVACAEGQDVLGAGEISFRRTPGGPQVHEVSNQSTGYRPDPDSWPTVAAALDRAGIARPDGFTHALVFRRCEGRGEHNVVREAVCVFRDDDLPPDWNMAASRQPQPHGVPRISA